MKAGAYPGGNQISRERTHLTVGWHTCVDFEDARVRD